MLPKKIAFVDIETTGGSLRGDRVIEIGIVRIEDNKLISSYNSLINPQRHLPEEITRLTGITRTQLENAPSFFDIKEQILEMIEGCVMVAHNVRFDYSFLKNEFKLFNIDFSPKHFCTVKLSRSLFPTLPRHNLDSIIENFQIKCENRHRALDDAMVLWEFYQKVLNSVSEEVIFEAIERGLKKPTVPLNLPHETIKNLPETSGVYIFYGENGMPLYIGKSINIKKRVMSHFSSDHLSSFELKIAQQVKSIETIETPGEMGALFKESSLIKKMQPLYNRKLRLSRKLFVLKKYINEYGYKACNFDTMSTIKTFEIEEILGIFRSKKQIKQTLIHLAKEYELCEKLLGVEKVNGECFGYRLGRCKGGCKQKEDFQSYNERFDQAFKTSHIKPWPYKGAIMITETDTTNQNGEAHIFDKWCYMGRMTFDEWGSSEFYSQDIEFDLDTYKILDQFLRSQKSRRKIKVVDMRQLQLFSSI